MQKVDYFFSQAERLLLSIVLASLTFFIVSIY